MKKKIMISAIAATAIFGATAQMNSPMNEGYHNRAISMYDDKNYQGCIDQMSQLLELNPTAQQQEMAEYYIAMSSMMKGEADACTMLEDFIAKYPASTYRVDAQMAVADCYFNDEDYATALAQYKMVEPKSLDYSRAQDYAYRKAYCHLRLADYLDAANGFLPLLKSKEYGNSAKFYTGYIAYTNKDYNAALDLLNQVNPKSELGEMSEYYKSQIYFLNKDYKRALSTSQKLLKSDNVDLLYTAEANRIAGESLYNLGDIVSAIPYLQSYVDAVESPLPTTRYILGVSQYKNHEYTQAIESLEGVVGEDNAMGQGAYLLIGQSLLKKKDHQAAMLALNKAVKMDHDLEMQELAFYNYAVASSQGGVIPFGNSVANFEEFLRRFPNSPFAPKVQEYVVTGYMADNNYEQALKSIEEIKKPSTNILKAKQRVLYTLGARDFAQNKVTQAISRFNQSKAYAKYDVTLAREVDLWLGNCYYAQEEYDDAADYYLAYVDASADDEPNLPLAYYNLAYARYKSGRYDDAITNFENALDDPGELDSKVVADAYCRMGDCFYFKKDYAAAAESYDRAYEENKATGDYALYQKAMMKGHSRDVNAKIEILDEMLEEYPSSGIAPSALLEKAQCYIDQDRYNQAIETYKQLVREYPATAQGRNGYLQLAIAYLNNGSKDEAIEAYKNVITNYATSDEAQVASQDLMRLYAADDQLESYTAFMSTVPGAMPIEQTDIEEAAYNAAEAAYLNNNDVSQLRSYVKKYPGAAHEVDALEILVDYEYENNNEDKALAYAEEIISRYPDNASVELALSIKAEIEYNQGKAEKALADYQKLEKCASSTAMLNEARMGILRAAYDLEKYGIVLAKADELLKSQNDDELESEVMYAKAVSLSRTGKAPESIELWETLAEDVEDIYGAMSAVELSQYYYEIGELENARIVVEEFLASGTPHQYWLARGYIVLSDINRKEGKTFEANEYLRTLRDNYPGGDADIFKMIDERLK